jgi:hypothetical protein
MRVEQEEGIEQDLVFAYEYFAGEVVIVVLEVEGTPPCDRMC